MKAFFMIELRRQTANRYDKGKCFIYIVSVICLMFMRDFLCFKPLRINKRLFDKVLFDNLN